MKVWGYPRIMDHKLCVEPYTNLWKKIICYFYELDMVVFIYLMFTPYSIFVASVLLSVHFRFFSPLVAQCLIKLLTELYVFLRGLVLYYGIIKKGTNGIRRGEPIWKNARWLYLGIEISFLATFILCLWLILIKNGSGVAILILLLSFLIILFAWILIPMVLRAPVTNLLTIWELLDNEIQCPHSNSTKHNKRTDGPAIREGKDVIS